MKRHIQVAMLGLIVLVAGVVAACGGGPEIPDDVEYEVSQVDYGSAGRGAFSVSIEKEITYKAAWAIANKVRQDHMEENPGYKVELGYYNMTVEFRLPGSSYWDEPYTRPWAHFIYTLDNEPRVFRDGSGERGTEWQQSN